MLVALMFWRSLPFSVMYVVPKPMSRLWMHVGPRCAEGGIYKVFSSVSSSLPYNTACCSFTRFRFCMESDFCAVSSEKVFQHELCVLPSSSKLDIQFCLLKLRCSDIIESDFCALLSKSGKQATHVFSLLLLKKHKMSKELEDGVMCRRENPTPYAVPQSLQTA
jgi:hypothetical protein